MNFEDSPYDFFWGVKLLSSYAYFTVSLLYFLDIPNLLRFINVKLWWFWLISKYLSFDAVIYLNFSVMKCAENSP